MSGNHAPESASDSAYDIYVVAHVDELKREHAELWGRYEAVVHENALLNARLDKIENERRQRHHEESFEWLSM